VIRKLTPGNCSYDQERFGSGRDRIGQRGIRRFVGQVLLAGEESHEGAALVRDMIADCTAKHWIACFERVQNRTLRDRAWYVQLHFAIVLGERSQMRREQHSNHIKSS